MRSENGNVQIKVGLIATLVIVLVIVAFIGFIMWLGPVYRVWSQEMAGRAERSRAYYNKQIIEIEAQARLEAEKLNAEAEVARAKGAAEAMYIVEDALTETYIRYLWVRMMADNQNVIYIPTEASLPILEINRNIVTELRD